MVCLVGLVNAFNMSDGIDGLAGVLALVALLGLGTVAYIGGRFPMVAGLVIAGLQPGGVSGVQRATACGASGRSFSWGMPGSTLLGFAVVWFSVSLSQGEQAVMTPITALWLFAVPLFGPDNANQPAHRQ